MKYINTTNTEVSYLTAVTAALKGADLSPAQVRFTRTERQDKLYYLAFHTDWMEYEAYVDADTGELVGLNAEPSVDEDYADICRYEFLFSVFEFLGLSA